VTLGLDVLEETRAVNAELERFLATQPPIHTLPAEAVRRARRAERGPFPAPLYLPQARWETISGGGDLRVRVLDPAGEAAGTYLHLHGGGWTLGAADMQDLLLWELVEATGFATVSVDYRRAPEDPWPACADDCEDAALWLLDRGAGRVTIGGESAGAQLAVVTLLRLRDRHGVDVRDAFAAANLVFGAFDLSGTPSRRLYGPGDAFLPESAMDWFIGGLLPRADPEARRDPQISPLYADLRDLPPALFTVGTRDPLLDDSLFMAARWSAAGNDAELRVWEEAVHGFSAFRTEAARRSRAEQSAFVRG
jgi:acetyl esterase